MFRATRLVLALGVVCFALSPLHSQDVTPVPVAVPATEPQAAPVPQTATEPTTVVKPQADAAKGNEDAEEKSAAESAAKTRAKNTDNDKLLAAAKVHNPILWKDPGDISKLNLFYGLGGEKHQPKAPYTFLAEDKSGTNPKFDVRDANDKKWRVKLGEEARPEVVASRLLWAVGYFANEDYLQQTADVANLKISRGDVKGEQIVDARFARKPGGQSKIGTWQWKSNPFGSQHGVSGQREFNGLRVMMAVINNWDLKDENNAVFMDEKTGQQVFLVSDVGATFATNTRELSRSVDKGNLESFQKSKFIVKRTETAVSFGTPAPPTGALLKSGGMLAGDYFRRKGFGWIGTDIPLADVRWVASLLSQLSHEQIADAFRAAHFPAAEADIYVDLVANRIQLLKEL